MAGNTLTIAVCGAEEAVLLELSVATALTINATFCALVLAGTAQVTTALATCNSVSILLTTVAPVGSLTPTIVKGRSAQSTAVNATFTVSPARTETLEGADKTGRLAEESSS